MWKADNRAEFLRCVGDLLPKPEVQAMNGVGAHHTTNCYEHSVFVAYTSFLFCRFWNLDYVAAARGGLLHDLFLYDRKEKDSYEGRHISAHPRAALENAERITTLTEKERDIIGKHMWPMTRPLPRFLESFVVSTADKVCAAAEATWVYGMLRARRGLNFRDLLPIPARAAV